MGKWKFNPGDRVLANEKAPGDYRGRHGIIIERGPGVAEYTVSIDDQTVCLNSWWLDPIHEESTRQR
jgi:hypothetical protein